MERKIKFIDKKNTGFYKAKIKGFEFTISGYCGKFYVVAVHKTKDIRLNTLWIGKDFPSFELAEDFCFNFNYKDYHCLGADS